MLLLPQQPNPWVEMGNQQNQGWMKLAQLIMQHKAQERADTLAQLQEKTQTVREQTENARVQTILEALKAGQQPSGLGFVQKKTENVPAPEQYSQMAMSDYGQIPTKQQETITHLPINMEAVKGLGPSMPHLLDQGLVGVVGGTPQPTSNYNIHFDTSGNIVRTPKIGGGNPEVFQNGKWQVLTEPLPQKPPTETGTLLDEKYDKLRAKQIKNEPLTNDEKAFLVSYKERKTMAPNAYGGFRLEIAGLPKPTTIPGITYSPNKGYEETLPDGTKKKLTTGEVQDRGLSYKELIPTETTKVMQQIAPTVLDLANKLKQDVIKQVDQLGPAAGRWNEFMTGKVGAPNPDFKQLKVDASYLSTLMMRMHVGARGSNIILKEFKDMFDAGKDSPENLISAIDTTINYANKVMKRRFGETPQTPSGGNLTPTHQYIPGKGIVPMGGQ